MKRSFPLIVWAALALFLAGCGPTLTIVNSTSFPVRAVVRSAGRSEVLSPSPGESSTAEMKEGKYTVTVIPDREWLDYAKITRTILNEQLANADKLTGPQLLEVIRRLKDIATRMQQFETAAGSSQSCSGSLQSDSIAVATVSLDANGQLAVFCR